MSKDGKKKADDRPIAENRKARHNYAIEETLETGIVLKGSEVKALREGKGSLNEAYARVERGELWLLGFHVSPYSNTGYTAHEPDRPKKLLAHAKEIERLGGKAAQGGYAIVPLKAYWKDRKAKVLIGLGKGKKIYDKREDQKKREDQRDMDRAMKGRR